MSSELLRSVEHEQLRTDLPELRPGDDVRVHFRIIEGDRQRIQVVRGIIMRLRGGKGANANFTVRRVASHGVGVERTFPMHSPRIEKIEILRHSHVRRAQLYFLRKRRGKAARLKERRR
jgi:large subunit ribosomal protein L19